jgi:hypothetical protein
MRIGGRILPCFCSTARIEATRSSPRKRRSSALLELRRLVTARATVAALQASTRSFGPGSSAVACASGSPNLSTAHENGSQRGLSEPGANARSTACA